MTGDVPCKCASGTAGAAPKPDVMVDVATLTGACVVALGEHAAGLFSNNAELADGLVACGKRCAEVYHPMPIYDGHRDELKCAQADLNSIGSSRWGGSCTAAAFLEHFVEKGVAWAHLDVAGPAMTSVRRASSLSSPSSLLLCACIIFLFDPIFVFTFGSMVLSFSHCLDSKCV